MNHVLMVSGGVAAYLFSGWWVAFGVARLLGLKRDEEMVTRVMVASALCWPLTVAILACMGFGLLVSLAAPKARVPTPRDMQLVEAEREVEAMLSGALENP